MKTVIAGSVVAMRYVLAAALLISGVAVAQELLKPTNDIETLTVEQAKALAQQEDYLSFDGRPDDF